MVNSSRESQSGRILIVEDQIETAQAIAVSLERAGHSTHIIDNGEDALRFVDNHRPDIVILDVDIPGKNGVEVCRLIRSETLLPVIILSGKKSQQDEINGKRAGADYYLFKPLRPDVLRFYTEELLQKKGNSEIFHLGNLLVNRKQHTVAVDGTKIELSEQKYKCLLLLIELKEEVVTFSNLHSHLKSGPYDGDTGPIKMLISRLRDDLTNSGANVSIKSARNVGYRLTAS